MKEQTSEEQNIFQLIKETPEGDTIVKPFRSTSEISDIIVFPLGEEEYLRNVSDN